MPRVTVILTDAQYAKFKEKAGDVPLSRWFRTLASNELFWNPVPTPEQQADIDKRFPKIGDTVTIKTPPRFKPDDLQIADIDKIAFGGIPKIMIGDEQVIFCEHGATFPNCKKWGCKFYEIANGRK